MYLKNCKFEVIGSNKATKHLEGLVFSMPNFLFSKENSIVATEIGDYNITLDIKTVFFIDNEIILEGFASDDALNVGRISVKYFT